MPPKRNKKPSRNGFWQFVLECRDKNPNKNMEEAKAYASKKWANMTKDEKQRYAQLASLARDNINLTKYTTDGYEIEEIERQEREAEDKVRQMKNSIFKNFKAASLDGNLADQIFILIHINHLTYVPAEDKFYICEIALASVSLQNGIEEIFTKIVKPGKLPLGFHGPALAHSKETHHLIDIVQEEPFENNTQEVFYGMIEFIKKYSNHKVPILYADEKTFEMTTNVINNFCQEFEFADEIRVYNMEYMFYALKNVAAGKTVWPTETFSYSEIEKDVYCYCPNLGCEFHEMADNSSYCSKSIITRYAYIICDNCCVELNIQLTPGFHIPLKAKVTQESKFNSRTSSMTSIDNIGPRGRMSSASSQCYEENYPPLGSHSSMSSLISFSSMKSQKLKTNHQLTASNVAALEESFQRASSVSELKRDHKNLKFPTPGYKQKSQNQKRN